MSDISVRDVTPHRRFDVMGGWMVKQQDHLPAKTTTTHHTLISRSTMCCSRFRVLGVMGFGV